MIFSVLQRKEKSLHFFSRSPVSHQTPKERREPPSQIEMTLSYERRKAGMLLFITFSLLLYLRVVRNLFFFGESPPDLNESVKEGD